VIAENANNGMSAALDRFKNIVFQTLFKESKNESPL
jgi:hypothetical protein